MPTIDIERDAAHEAAQRELAAPIYPRASLSDQIANWLNDLLFRLVLNGSSIPGGWFTIVILMLAVLAAVIVAVRIARRTMGSARDTALFDTHVLSAAEHRSRAERSAAQGDWSSAIRQRLRAIGRQLEQDGVLNPVSGRTAGELARDAGQSLPGFAGDLLRAATVFNDVTYGQRPGTEANYRLVADLDDRLRRHAPAAATEATATAENWTPLQ